MTSYQLAQLNLASALGPREDPRMADFYGALAKINGAAEAAPGFVWRLQDEAGDATGIQAFPDPTVLVTMSVWQDLESLRAFVYESEHLAYLRRRKEWFRKSHGPNMVLWWIPAGHIPTLGEARQRLDHLAASGPTPHAFAFPTVFEAHEVAA
ncbi:MAG: DUF3291 domain-containing protein [Rhodothermales bacterium]|nr:DUF3291 domain-containing protein [Rhodothermales bacterium]MBO6779127.1 DUF3291 domain-containing protein [Rhodothermales bacterium]